MCFNSLKIPLKIKNTFYCSSCSHIDAIDQSCNTVSLVLLSFLKGNHLQFTKFTKKAAKPFLE